MIESNELDLPVRLHEIPNYSNTSDIESSIFIRELNRKITEVPFTAPDDNPVSDQGQEGGAAIWVAGGKGLQAGGLGIRVNKCPKTNPYCHNGGLRYSGSGGKTEPGIPVHSSNARTQKFTNAHDPAFRLKNSV